MLPLLRPYGGRVQPFRILCIMSINQFAVQHLVWLFRDTGWPLGIKYIAVCILALGISWWFSKIVLKKLPCFS